MKEFFTMKVDELLMLQGLAEVAKEAKEAAEIISKAYAKAFGIKEDKIVVWNDSHNYEYLTHDGIWQARYLHQTYDVDCTADGIFEYLKADYLIQNGYASPYMEDSCYLSPEGTKQEVVRYFRVFVNRASKLISSESSKDTENWFPCEIADE